MVNEFTESDTEPFARDCPDDTDVYQPWVAGDEIQIVDQYGTVTEASLEVLSVAEDNIEIELPSSPPTTTEGQEDIIRIAAYDSAAARQTTTWVYVADGNNQLGGDDDDAFEYVHAAEI